MVFYNLFTEMIINFQHFPILRRISKTWTVIDVALCSGYVRKETAVVSIVLPFVNRGLAHFAAHLKNFHLKNEKNLRWTPKKRKKWTVN